MSLDPSICDSHDFKRHVDRDGPGGCHMWTGPRDGDGFGRYVVDGESVAAHRLVFAKGSEYGFGYLRHTCGNRACVRLAHLVGPRAVKWQVRFWAKVQRRGIDECWDWTGATNAGGYGVIRVDGKTEYVHRIAWFLAPEEGWYGIDFPVGHTCGNRICTNYRHLFALGAPRDLTD
jgi:hypothetical protein